MSTRSSASRKESGADAIYPGYGFLSENPELAAGGGRERHHLHRPALARCSRWPATRSPRSSTRSPPACRCCSRRRPRDDVDALVAQADDIGFPIFAKAVAGGGGRGMRRVETRRRPARPRSPRRCARPTAPSATRRMFLEQAVLRPRHIEVQILADATGDTVHLFERDCSVQRRHQKVIEIAPAPNLDRRPARRRSTATRSRSRESIGYVNAGTVEFLARHGGRARRRARLHRDEPAHPGRAHRHRRGHRRRPRAVADAHRRGRDPRRPRAHAGAHPAARAPPCSAASPRRTRRRASGPTPARSRRTARRAAPASGSTAARSPRASQISPHFDSMLAKLTCRGRDFPAAVARAKRALAEFRIRGVSTNIPFLQAVLDDPAFVAGDLSTSFIDERPQLLNGRESRDRGTKLLNWLADVTVNQPERREAGLASTRPSKLPAHRPRRSPRRPDRASACSSSARPASPRALREQTAARGDRDDLPRRAPVAARDPGAHQRPRRASAPHVARMTPAAALGRGLGRCDLRRRAALPRRRPVGAPGRAPRGDAEHRRSRCCCAAATPSATRRTRPRSPTRSCARPRPPASTSSASSTRSTTSTRCAPRSTRCSRPAPRSPRSRSATPPTCSTRPRTSTRSTTTCGSPTRSSSRARTSSRSRTWRACCGRRPRRSSSPRCASASTCRCTCTRTTPRAASSPRCSRRARAGVGCRGCRGRAAVGHHEPAVAVGARRRPRAHRARHRHSTSQAVSDLEPYWEAVRHLYSPFESGLPGPTGRVYHHEIPGGQLSNLRQQAIALGHRRRLRAHRGHVRRRRPHPRPHPQGDAVVEGRRRPRAAPRRGERRPGRLRGEPAELRHPRLGRRLHGGRARRPARRLAGAVPHQGARGPQIVDRRHRAHRRRARRRSTATPPTRRRTLNRLLFPGPAKEFEQIREPYGDLSALGTRRLPLRAEARRRARRRDRAGRAALRRARGDRRGGRRRACAPS